MGPVCASSVLSGAGEELTFSQVVMGPGGCGRRRVTRAREPDTQKAQSARSLHSDNSRRGHTQAMADSSDGLSAYERKRLENIEKNKQVLEALGLLDGGGLMQRKSSGSHAATMRREPKEKVVVEKRERIQRSVRPVQRLDPGAERLRKVAAARAAAGLPEMVVVGASSPLDGPAPAFRKVASGYGAPPIRLDYGLSDAVVFKHFYGNNMTSAFAFSAPPPAAAEAVSEEEEEEEEDNDEEEESVEGEEIPPAVDDRLQVFYEGEVRPARGMQNACALPACAHRLCSPPVRIDFVRAGRRLVLGHGVKRRAPSPRSRWAPPGQGGAPAPRGLRSAYGCFQGCAGGGGRAV